MNFLAGKKVLSEKQFVLNCAPNESEEKTVFYYNRMGSYKSKGIGKRQLKTQGSVKIDTHCSAHIKAVEEFSTDEKL